MNILANFHFCYDGQNNVRTQERKREVAALVYIWYNKIIIASTCTLVA